MPAEPDRSANRYSRQTRVAGVGDAGQERIRAASVMIVGCGALGTHAADALARAGVGTLHLVDRDVVEWSNLQRQVLFTEADAAAGKPKAVAAADNLVAANRDVRLEPHVADCTASFLQDEGVRADVVLDGTDNFATRYLLNDWCKQQQLPWIYAGAVGTEGAAMVVTADGPCLRCLWPDPPAQSDVGNCETAGILAPAIASVTAFQVAETLKLLVGEPPTRGVYTCDVWRGQFGVMPVADRPADDCIACARGELPALTAAQPDTATMCGRDAVQVDPPRTAGVDLDAIAEHVRGSASGLERTPHLLRFEVDGVRFTVFPGGRALLFGVRDPLRARALYDRWLGFR